MPEVVLEVDSRVVLWVGAAVLRFRLSRGGRASLAAEWFETMDTPAKELVWFEDSAHDMMNEQPGLTLLSLVQVVRPFAHAEAPAQDPERETLP